MGHLTWSCHLPRWRRRDGRGRVELVAGDTAVFNKDDISYILALYKFTVIMVKVVRKLEHYEIMPMGMNAHINNHVTPMLEAKLKEL